MYIYCTFDQLVAHCPEGERELIQLTDREPYTGLINDEVLDDAVNLANSKIDGYLRSVYTLPLPEEWIPGSVLPEICCDLVRYILYKNTMTEDVRTRYKDALALLRDIQAKKIALGVLDATVPSTGRTVIKAGVSGFDWETF